MGIVGDFSAISASEHLACGPWSCQSLAEGKTVQYGRKDTALQCTTVHYCKVFTVQCSGCSTPACSVARGASSRVGAVTTDDGRAGPGAGRHLLKISGKWNGTQTRLGPNETTW